MSTASVDSADSEATAKVTNIDNIKTSVRILFYSVSPSWGLSGFTTFGELSIEIIHHFWGVVRRRVVMASMPKDTAYQKAYAAFLAKLKQARLDAGLTQQDVTDKLGKARTFMSKVELGERRIDVVELKTLAKLYGKALSHFD